MTIANAPTPAGAVRRAILDAHNNASPLSHPLRRGPRARRAHHFHLEQENTMTIANAPTPAGAVRRAILDAHNKTTLARAWVALPDAGTGIGEEDAANALLQAAQELAAALDALYDEQVAAKPLDRD